MKAMYRAALMVAAFVFLLPLSARSEIKAGSFEVSPFGGYNFFENKQNLKDRPVFGGRFGYNFTKNLGIEAAGEFINSRVDDVTQKWTKKGQFTSPIDSVKITFYHLDLVYHFMPEGKFNPFIVAGYGAANYSPKINNKNMSVIDFGVGAKYWVRDNIAFRVDLRDNMVYDEKIHNIQATLGIVFTFGGKAKPAPTPGAKYEPIPERKPEPKPGARLTPPPPSPPKPRVQEKIVILVPEPTERVDALTSEDINLNVEKATLKPEAAQTILKRKFRL